MSNLLPFLEARQSFARRALATQDTAPKKDNQVAPGTIRLKPDPGVNPKS
jgi:hypothetical protein